MDVRRGGHIPLPLASDAFGQDAADDEQEDEAEGDGEGDEDDEAGCETTSCCFLLGWFLGELVGGWGGWEEREREKGGKGGDKN